MNYLLLISCSERKVLSSETLAAIGRYDGPTYRCLRKRRREGHTLKNLDVLIISAKYGLLTYQQPVDLYNQLMTPRRAEELRPVIQSRLKSFIEAKKGDYAQVYINLGRTYMKTLEGFHWGLLSTLEASGGIGLKTQRMKAWLERIYQEQEVN